MVGFNHYDTPPESKHLDHSCGLMPQRGFGNVISRKMIEKSLLLREIAHTTHKERESKSFSRCINSVAGTCIMGGIIWMEFNSSEDLPPAQLLLQWGS